MVVETGAGAGIETAVAGIGSDPGDPGGRRGAGGGTRVGTTGGGDATRTPEMTGKIETTGATETIRPTKSRASSSSKGIRCTAPRQSSRPWYVVHRPTSRRDATPDSITRSHTLSLSMCCVPEHTL